MKKVYENDDLAWVGHLQSILEAEGVKTLLRNELLGGGRGELPFVDTWPEIWVMNDEDEARARLLITEATKPLPAGSANWTCTNCNETVDAPLTECWNCGATQPADNG